MPSYKALYNNYGDRSRQKQPMQLDALKAAQSSMQPRTPTSNNAMQGIGSSVTAMQRARQLASPRAQAYRLAAQQSQGPTMAPGGPGGTPYNPAAGYEEQMPGEALQQRSAQNPGDRLPPGPTFGPGAPLYSEPLPVDPRYTEREVPDYKEEYSPPPLGPTSSPEDSPSYDPFGDMDTADVLERTARQLLPRRDLEEETAYLETMGDRNLGQALADARGRWGAMGLGGAGMAAEGDLATQMALATSGKVFDLEQAERDEFLRNALGSSSIYESTRGGNRADAALEAGLNLINPDGDDGPPPTQEEAEDEAEKQLTLKADLSRRLALEEEERDAKGVWYNPATWRTSDETETDYPFEYTKRSA